MPTGEPCPIWSYVTRGRLMPKCLNTCWTRPEQSTPLVRLLPPHTYGVPRNCCAYAPISSPLIAMSSSAYHLHHRVPVGCGALILSVLLSLGDGRIHQCRPSGVTHATSGGAALAGYVHLAGLQVGSKLLCGRRGLGVFLFVPGDGGLEPG